MLSHTRERGGALLDLGVDVGFDPHVEPRTGRNRFSLVDPTVHNVRRRFCRARRSTVAIRTQTKPKQMILAPGIPAVDPCRKEQLSLDRGRLRIPSEQHLRHITALTTSDDGTWVVGAIATNTNETKRFAYLVSKPACQERTPARRVQGERR